MNTYVTAVRVDRLSSGERARLNRQLGMTCDKVRRLIDRTRDGDGYAHEKVTGFQWNINAILGFDQRNGHDDERHRVWALGELGTLRNLLEEDA